MDKANLTSQIQLNLKEIYHKAIDADKLLDEQRKQGNAKFSQLFADDSLFKSHHKHFLPYVEELASDLVLLEESEDEQHFVAQLKLLVAKIEQMHQLLNQIKQLS